MITIMTNVRAVALRESQTYLLHHEFATIILPTTYENANPAWHHAPGSPGGQASPPDVHSASGCTVGGTATPTAWKTRPAVPCNSLRSRKRLPWWATST